MENNTSTRMVYSDPYMTSEQMVLFEKECLWNDGWWNGRKNGYRQGTRSGLLTGLIVGGILSATVIVATWMYKNNKVYRVDITDISEEKGGSDNAED